MCASQLCAVRAHSHTLAPTQTPTLTWSEKALAPTHRSRAARSTRHPLPHMLFMAHTHKKQLGPVRPPPLTQLPVLPLDNLYRRLALCRRKRVFEVIFAMHQTVAVCTTGECVGSCTRLGAQTRTQVPRHGYGALALACIRTVDTRSSVLHAFIHTLDTNAGRTRSCARAHTYTHVQLHSPALRRRVCTRVVAPWPKILKTVLYAVCPYCTYTRALTLGFCRSTEDGVGGSPRKGGNEGGEREGVQ